MRGNGVDTRPTELGRRVGEVGAHVDGEDVIVGQQVGDRELDRHPFLGDDDAAEVPLRHGSAQCCGWLVAPQGGGTQGRVQLVSILRGAQRVVGDAGDRRRKRIWRRDGNAIGVEREDPTQGLEELLEPCWALVEGEGNWCIAEVSLRQHQTGSDGRTALDELAAGHAMMLVSHADVPRFLALACSPLMPRAW
jgi:hypothetical protein